MMRTVGVEEEFILVDPVSGVPVPVPVAALALSAVPARAAVTGEL